VRQQHGEKGKTIPHHVEEKRTKQRKGIYPLVVPKTKGKTQQEGSPSPLTSKPTKKERVKAHAK
jgi:hypothetical protein